MGWRERRALRRLDRALQQEPDPSTPSLEQLTYDLRRLDQQRRSGPTDQSEKWRSAVLRAYDLRLRSYCNLLGVQEHLEPLEGMDRDLERLRLEQVVAQDPQGGPQPAPPIKDAPRRPIPAQTQFLGDIFPRAGLDPFAVKLVKASVVLLPLRQRARYREEFLGEVFEIAQCGAQPAEQILYAARLLWHVPALRRELDYPDESDEQEH